VEDRISGLKDKIEIKEKTEEILVKQLQSCGRNMQEFSDSIKRPNLRIIDIEEEKVKVKGICNIFNQITTENFPNPKKVFPIQVQGASRTPNRLDQYAFPWHIIIKTTNTKNRERILQAKREKTNNV
jgi:hypothetical protein